MVSSYLQRPIRTLEQALEDRARVRRLALERGLAPPASPAADPYDPIGVLVRQLANDPDAALGDSAPPDGRRAA